MTSSRGFARRWLVLIAIPAFCAAPFAIRVALADPCASSRVQLHGGSGAYPATPSYDSTLTIPGYLGAFRGRFDLPAGEVQLYHCCSIGQTIVRARDAYDVVGVPAGTPVSVVARFAIDGWVFTDGCGGAGCGGILRGAVSSGTDSSEIDLSRLIHQPSRVPANGEVLLPVTIVAGVPLSLDFVLLGVRAAGGSHGVEAIGRITFEGVPEGAGIVSCAGYKQIPVPTLPTSWGRLKSIYR